MKRDLEHETRRALGGWVPAHFEPMLRVPPRVAFMPWRPDIDFCRPERPVLRVDEVRLAAAFGVRGALLFAFAFVVLFAPRFTARFAPDAARFIGCAMRFVVEVLRFDVLRLEVTRFADAGVFVADFRAGVADFFAVRFAVARFAVRFVVARPFAALPAAFFAVRPPRVIVAALPMPRTVFGPLRAPVRRVPVRGPPGEPRELLFFGCALCSCMTPGAVMRATLV